MAKSTLISHIADAIQLQSLVNSSYIAIGKSSAWPDDSNPPLEDENITSISEIIGYKKVSQFSLARPLASGETTVYPVVTYSSQRYALVPVDKAYEQKARWLYAEASITIDDFPVNQYRQVGLYTGLVPVSGVTKQNLLPSEVANPGILRYFENNEPTYMTSSTTSTEQFLIKI